MRKKALAFVTAVLFLVVSSACSHSPQKHFSPSPREEISSPKGIARSLDTQRENEPWWKKDENQWILVVLVVLGVAIATSATILISSGSGGLSINVHK